MSHTDFSDDCFDVTFGDVCADYIKFGVRFLSGHLFGKSRSLGLPYVLYDICLFVMFVLFPILVSRTDLLFCWYNVPGHRLLFALVEINFGIRCQKLAC